MTFTGSFDNFRFLELQQSRVIAGLQVSLNSGPIATYQTCLARVPGRNFLSSLCFQNRYDAEKAVGLRCEIFSILLSQCWTAQLHNSAWRYAELFRCLRKRHPISHSGDYVGDRIPGLLLRRGHGVVLTCCCRPLELELVLSGRSCPNLFSCHFLSSIRACVRMRISPAFYGNCVCWCRRKLLFINMIKTARKIMTLFPGILVKFGPDSRGISAKRNTHNDEQKALENHKEFA